MRQHKHEVRGTVGRRQRVDPYVVVALGALVLLTVQTLNRQWSTDFWIHHATVDALRRDLFDPLHPLTGTTDPSEYFSPYAVALAAFGRATGFSTVTVLQLAAIANLALFLVAFRLFVVEITGRRLVATFALIATFVAWGVDPWRWSGFLNLNSIGFGLPYPSMFATGLGLLVAWAFLRYLRAGPPGWLVSIAAGYALVALSHPFTGAWVAIVLVTIAVQEGLAAARVPLLVASAVAIGIVLALWPYYPWFELLTKGDAYAGAHDPLYDGTALRLAATIPGFVVVANRLRGNRRDALALMAVAGVGVYAIGAVVGAPNLGRVLPLVVLPAHVGWGLVLECIVRGQMRNRWLVSAAGIALVVGVAGVTAGLPRMVPRALLPGSLRDDDSLQAVTEPYDGLEGALPSGSVVVAETRKLGQVAPSFDLAVVVPGWAAAFVDGVDTRRAVAAEILGGNLARQDRYDVTAVLCATDGCVDRFRRGGTAASGPSWTLMRLPSPDA